MQPVNWTTKIWDHIAKMKKDNYLQHSEQIFFSTKLIQKTKYTAQACICPYYSYTTHASFVSWILPGCKKILHTIFCEKRYTCIPKKKDKH